MEVYKSRMSIAWREAIKRPIGSNEVRFGFAQAAVADGDERGLGQVAEHRAAANRAPSEHRYDAKGTRVHHALPPAHVNQHMRHATRDTLHSCKASLGP